MNEKEVPRVYSLSFTIDADVNPMEVYRHLRREFNARDTVLSIEAHINGTYVCNFVDEKPYKILLDEGIFLQSKNYRTKAFESNMVGFVIKQLPCGISNELVSWCLRGYGEVVFIDRGHVTFKGDNSLGVRRVIIALTKDLPYCVQIDGTYYEIEI